jgi:hypothetical protein
MNCSTRCCLPANNRLRRTSTRVPGRRRSGEALLWKLPPGQGLGHLSKSIVELGSIAFANARKCFEPVSPKTWIEDSTNTPGQE